MEQLVSVSVAAPRGSFGAFLRARRHRALLSQEQLAARAELSERTVRDLEAGLPAPGLGCSRRAAALTHRRQPAPTKARVLLAASSFRVPSPGTGTTGCGPAGPTRPPASPASLAARHLSRPAMARASWLEHRASAPSGTASSGQAAPSPGSSRLRAHRRPGHREAAGETAGALPVPSPRARANLAVTVSGRARRGLAPAPAVWPMSGGWRAQQIITGLSGKE